MKFSTCLLTSMINLAIRDDLNWIWQWIRGNCKQVTPLQVTLRHHIWRHHRSWELLRITHHIIELEPWARCHCVYLVMTYQLICNMIYVDQSSGKVIWPNLRSNFQIHLSGSQCFDAPRREEYDDASRFVSLFLCSKVICKNSILQKRNIFSLNCPENVKMRPRVVKSEIIGFRTFQTFCSLLLRGSIAIRGQMSWGDLPQVRYIRWWNGRCGRGGEQVPFHLGECPKLHWIYRHNIGIQWKRNSTSCKLTFFSEKLVK